MERYQKMKEERAELLKQLEKQKQQLEEQSRGSVSSSSPARPKQAAVSSSSVSSTTPSRSKIAPASSTSAKSPHSTSGKCVMGGYNLKALPCAVAFRKFWHIGGFEE